MNLFRVQSEGVVVVVPVKGDDLVDLVDSVALADPRWRFHHLPGNSVTLIECACKRWGRGWDFLLSVMRVSTSLDVRGHWSLE